jgi:hypothetical protein
MSTIEPSNEWSYKVNFWKTEVYKGKRKTTYYVRWGVNGEPFKEPFDNSTLAKSFRSDLEAAARKGEPFHIRKGLPASKLRETKPTVSWYVHACAYADMKWPDAAPKSRVGIAETLATVTPVLLATQDGMPDRDVLRKALYTWSFRTGSRMTGNPPSEADPPDGFRKTPSPSQHSRIRRSRAPPSTRSPRSSTAPGLRTRPSPASVRSCTPLWSTESSSATSRRIR